MYKAKLTDKQATHMRQLRSRYKYTQRSLSEKFGVSVGVVSNIIRYKQNKRKTVSASAIRILGHTDVI